MYNRVVVLIELTSSFVACLKREKCFSRNMCVVYH